MTWLYYRGSRRRTIAGPSTGKAYDCAPRSFVQAEDADVRGLLLMVKAHCGCGRMFQRRTPRGG